MYNSAPCNFGDYLGSLRYCASQLWKQGDFEFSTIEGLLYSWEYIISVWYIVEIIVIFVSLWLTCPYLLVILMVRINQIKSHKIVPSEFYWLGHYNEGSWPWGIWEICNVFLGGMGIHLVIDSFLLHSLY